MPTVVLNKSVFEKLVGKKLPEEELKNRISMLGTDLEKIEGDEIHVEIFPNRPDMLSEQGFARALSSFIGIKKGLRSYTIKPSGHKVIVDRNIKNIRPYTVCALVKNLELNDEKIREIIQIQEKLHTTFCRNRKKAAIGIYPLENIKMPISFKAMKPEEIRFVPLESNKEMTGRQVLTQHSKGREFAYLVEDLPMFPVFVDANQEILSLTPIINSHKTGKITDKTKEAFIEFSGFDLEYQKVGLNILAATLADMGAEVYSMEVVYPDKTVVTPDLTPREMKLNADFVNQILGLSLKDKEIKDYLERMGYGYKNGKVLVPAYRSDILHPIDLVEDIAIAHGYENFKEEIPKVATIASEDPEYGFISKLANTLIGLGLFEVNTYHITNKDILNTKMNCELDCIELSNALTEDYNVLRSWMLPMLMQLLRENRNRESPHRIFEIGTVFKKDGKDGIEEFIRLAVTISHPTTDYTEIKQIMESLFHSLGVAYKIDPTEHPSFIPGRVGRVSVKGEKVAYVGEIHPKVLNNFELENPVAALELNITDLMKVM